MEMISYELKYCERCGTLKLRPIDSGGTYCRRCNGMLARYTIPRGPRSANTGALSPSPELTILVRVPTVGTGDRIAELVK